MVGREALQLSGYELQRVKKKGGERRGWGGMLSLEASDAAGAREGWGRGTMRGVGTGER